MSLLKKVFVTIFALAAVALLLLSIAGVSFVRYGIRSSSATQQQQLAHEIISSLDRSLYERHNQVQLIGNVNAINNAVKAPVGSPAYQAGATELLQIAGLTGPWENVVVVSDTKHIALALDGQSVGDYATEADVQYEIVLDQALRGRAVYSDAFIDKATGRPTMLFAAPVRDNVTQTPRGAVIGKLAWSVVLESLQNRTDKTVELFNREGIELGDNRAEHAFEIFKESAANNPAAKDAMTGKEGSLVTYSLDEGEESLITYVIERGYKQYQGNRWILAVETTSREAFAVSDEIAMKLPPIFVAIILVTLAAVMYVLNRIVVRHVRTLTIVTRKIALGDLTQRTRIFTQDEFGELSATFNHMADKLQELYINLAKKAARTDKSTKSSSGRDGGDAE